MAAGRQASLPEDLAGAFVQRSQVVVRCRPDEDHAAAGDDVAADVEDAGGQRQVVVGPHRAGVAGRADRALPDHLAGGQVDRRQRPPRGCVAGDAQEVQPRMDRADVGRAVLGGVAGDHLRLVALAVPGRDLAAALERAARQHLDHEGDVVGVGNQQPALRVDGGAVPIHYAIEGGIDDGLAVHLRWGELALVTGLPELYPARQLIDRRRAPQVALLQVGRRHARQADRVGLGRREPISRRMVLRDRLLGHRRHRPTGPPIEHEEFAPLGALHQGRNDAALGGQVDQRRSHWKVHVPDVVVGRLEAPARGAGGDVQRHHRAGIGVVERPPIAAVVVRRGVAQRQVHHVEVRVGGIDPPGVGRAAGELLVGRRMRHLAGGPDVPGPDQLPGDRIESPHRA